MRTDFREERKWKMALAYNLSTAVLEWHAAGSLDERLRKRICVLWKRPRNEEVGEDENENENGNGNGKGGRFEQMDVDENAEDHSVPNPMVDYNSSDNDDDEADPEQKDVTDALDVSTAVQEALDVVEAAASEDGDHQPSTEQDRVKPKVEEREDLSALRVAGPNGPDDLMDVDGATQHDSQSNGNGEAGVSKSEEDLGPSVPSGLKPMSTDPMLTSTSPANAEASSSKPVIKSNVYAPMREHIAYSDENKLFVDLDDYEGLVMDLAALSTAETAIEAPPPPPDLSAIFPDLQPFGLLNVPPVHVSATSTDAKKKSDRKSDRDDPNKRAEDTSYTKLVPLGEFMHCKPTLIGPLNPAKRWRKGEWLSQEDTGSNSENDASAANEAMCGKSSY
jgi:chromatin modification-related protein VID21